MDDDAKPKSTGAGVRPVGTDAGRTDPDTRAHLRLMLIRMLHQNSAYFETRAETLARVADYEDFILDGRTPVAPKAEG